MKQYDDPHWYTEKYPEYDDPIQQNKQDQLLESGHHDVPDHFCVSLSQTHVLEQDTEKYPPVLQQPSRFQWIVGQFLIILPFVIIAFWSGWFSHELFIGSFQPSNASKTNAALIQEAWNKIDQNYVDRKDLDYRKMAYAAITAMLQSLGDTGHSRFMSPQDVNSERQLLNGRFTGIGIYLYQDPHTKAISVNATIPRSPAEKVGLKHGDMLVAINGISMQGKNIITASNLIDGQANTSVSITIQRSGEAYPRELHIIRAQIRLPSVVLHYMPENHIAHIQITQFSTGVSNQLRFVLNQAKIQGATKIILDLRNNPGGYLQEAIDTTSLFVKNGIVLFEEDRSGKRRALSVNGNPLDTSSQMIVLINRNSASAAEIVAGALKDDHRAILLGQKTYGTGTVLQQFMLSDGSALYLGTQEWLTPNDNFIRQNASQPGSGGINPNFSVSLPANVPILTPNAENEQHLTEQQILTSGDTQLEAAINFLVKS